MARFERRRTPQITKQPVGSIYNRSVNTAQNNNLVGNTTQNKQILDVLQKHDQLISKLLKRFNDFESTISAKIEKLIDAKLAEEKDALRTIINSKSENDTIPLTEPPPTGAALKSNENKKINSEVNMELLMAHLTDIKSNMLGKTDLEKEISIVKKEMENIVETNTAKYQEFSEEQIRNISMWMSDMSSLEKSEVLVEQYDQMKDNAFENVSIETSLEKSVEKSVEKSLEKSVEKPADFEIKTIKKNIELEITEDN